MLEPFWQEVKARSDKAKIAGYFMFNKVTEICGVEVLKNLKDKNLIKDNFGMFFRIPK